MNQPEEWWDHNKTQEICLDNQNSIRLLSESELEVEIIDKSTKGKAWVGKKRGVGWARKLAMDKAAELADANDLLVSIDADTFYPQEYFQSLSDLFTHNTHFAIHANPYYHPLTGRKAEDKAILRYEIYMRVYHINMMLIENPYAFSALGSAMVCTANQYLKMGGISPKMSGEDFYFIQHMRKNGPISQFNEVKVYPQARFSERVNFGTGPAMIKGDLGDWSSYPFYLPQHFQEIRKTYDSFAELFTKDIEIPMSEFLTQQLKKDSLWQSLRQNSKTHEKFEQACMQLVDGLRILQFLKTEHPKYSKGDKEDLLINLHYFATKSKEFSDFLQSIPLKKERILSFQLMKDLRDGLENLELSLRFEKPII